MCFSSDDEVESVEVESSESAELLRQLRREWLHLVSDTGVCEVYVGRRGVGRWGNRVTYPVMRTRCAHEVAVGGYGSWLLSRPMEMAEVRARLAGRVLGCHCRPGRGLPCHAEVLAAVANCSRDEHRALLGNDVIAGPDTAYCCARHCNPR